MYAEKSVPTPSPTRARKKRITLNHITPDPSFMNKNIIMNDSTKEKPIERRISGQDPTRSITNYCSVPRLRVGILKVELRGAHTLTTCRVGYTPKAVQFEITLFSLHLTTDELEVGQISEQAYIELEY